MEKLSIVVVTYKRQQLLSVLFDSLLELTTPPWRIVLVDNENSEETKAMTEEFNVHARKLWGPADIDELGGSDYLHYAPQETNGGGSGGFSAGVKRAYELGTEWFWLMDDDVAVLPDSIDKLSKWTDRFDVIQGRRYDYDGGPFYWQYDFIPKVGFLNPFAPEKFNSEGYLIMNNVCFEGGMFRRRIVERIGIPDPRFFIYWDDAVYGYLASKITTCVLVDEFVLRRTRDIQNWDIAGKRQLNSTSDLNRYHIMRNRGYIAQYFKEHGDYNPLAFGFGTFLTFSKEAVRIAIVDRKNAKSGIKQLRRGWEDARKLMDDQNWQPMPPLSDAPSSDASSADVSLGDAATTRAPSGDVSPGDVPTYDASSGGAPSGDAS